MLKQSLTWFISALLLVAVIPQAARADRQDDRQPATIETVKSHVAKIGVGEKARATITKKDGSKIKGYVARADETEFVIRDRKTDAATTISYADVARVERNKGHSTAKHLGIGIAVGVGAVVTTLLILIAHLD